MRSQVNEKRGVAIRMSPYQRSIEKDLSIHVHALEIQLNLTTRPRRRCLELVAVPTNTGRKKTAIVAHGMVGFRFTQNAPIVGQCDICPSLLPLRSCQ